MQQYLCNVTYKDVLWLPGESSSLVLCPICKALDYHQLQLSVPSLADGSTRNLFQCKTCDSRFFNPPELCEFSEITGDSENFHKHYCEVGAGIWEMFWPLAMTPVSMGATLLDIGCGFGYTVDCWRTIRGEAIGVELAEYGKLGARLLNIPIYFEYLRNVSELKDTKFDVVYASEVIEHVLDPEAFVLELSSYINSNGFLVLTTPNAAFIKPENGSPTLIAALSPGFHGFLFSACALKKILHNAGFFHVIVREFNERIVAWSSKRAFTLSESLDKPRKDYLSYLQSAVQKLENQHDLVYDGILYRFFRDQLNAGDIDAAAASLQKLEVSLVDKYGPEVLSPQAVINALSTWSSHSQFAKLYPYFLPNYFYYRGIFGLQKKQDSMYIVQCFSTSWMLTEVAAERLGTHSFLEALSLIWVARLRENLGLLALGKLDSIIGFLEQAVESTDSVMADFGFSKLNVAQIELIFESTITQLSMRGKTSEFGQALLIMEQYLSKHYEQSAIHFSQGSKIIIRSIQTYKLYLILGHGLLLMGNTERAIECLNMIINQIHLVKDKDENIKYQLEPVMIQAKQILAQANHIMGLKKESDIKWVNKKITYSFSINKKN